MKYLIFLLFFVIIFNSCMDVKRDKFHTKQGLKPGTEEYNLGLLKIYSFENDKGHIDQKKAKELGFSSKQITQFKKEIRKGNIYIQKEKAKGSIIEPFNLNNLSPEEYLEKAKKGEIVY
ncbi:hypothetical protein [Chishuiella sp.]|uniref:hypothetical protein n=1 Tax=Chishuiella sp. TaxID=1969467 RepID=UPI0028ABBB2A|nr:hypothetical protein [Chishuiella sp.]